jgi:DNA-binding protein HU-beta
MNQGQFIDALADIAEISKADARRIVLCVADLALNALYAGETADIPGIGRLDTRVRPARTGRNPGTGDEIQIPARSSVTFKPAKRLREALPPPQSAISRSQERRLAHSGAGR